MNERWIQGKLGFLEYEDICDKDPKRARMAMLFQGYTEAAIAFGTYINGEKDVYVSKENPYNIGEGYYVRSSLFEHISESFEPDTPEEDDPLRDYILEEIERFKEIQEELSLYASFISPEVWLFDVYTGKVRFLLNPAYPTNPDEKLEYGFYTVEEIFGLLKKDPKCPIYHKNSKKKELLDVKKVKEYHREGLRRLAEDGNGGFNDRLLRIALMICRYPDLVEEYREYLPKRSQY